MTADLTHDWCPPDRPYPASYEAAATRNPDLCIAVDPCLPDGTTLWTIAPCDPTPVREPGYPMVKEPTQSLPATGLDVPAPLFGGTLAILAGIALVRLELRGRRS